MLEVPPLETGKINITCSGLADIIKMDNVNGRDVPRRTDENVQLFPNKNVPQTKRKRKQKQGRRHNSQFS